MNMDNVVTILKLAYLRFEQYSDDAVNGYGRLGLFPSQPALGDDQRLHVFPGFSLCSSKDRNPSYLLFTQTVDLPKS